MHKTNTKDYEVLARFLSSKPLYEVRFEDQIYISYTKDLIWKCYGKSEIINTALQSHVLCKAHTVRGAWKKACKILQK